MKRAFLLSALAGLLLTPALSACQNSLAPAQLSANRLAAQSSVRTSAAARSDEGLRKGVIELRKVRFSKWDKNVNGVLTRDEVSDENMALPGVISGFKDYDSNNDGQITPAEFLREDVIIFWMNLIRPKVDELFSKHDKDGNRLLTVGEQDKVKLFFSPWPKLKGGDLNQDGVITYSEFEDAYMEVLPFFQQPVDRQALPNI